MTTKTFDVELRPIDAIKPYETNPRLNDDAVDTVAASLKEFGFRQPIVIYADGVIIVGHTRWKAAKKAPATTSTGRTTPPICGMSRRSTRRAWST